MPAYISEVAVSVQNTGILDWEMSALGEPGGEGAEAGAFNRVRMDQMELNILRGILTEIGKIRAAAGRESL